MHQLDQVGGEERILLGVVQLEGMPLQDLRPGESHLGQFLDEDTLRQGSRYSTGPRRWVGENLGRQVVLVQRQVGHAQAPTRAEHPVRLGEDAALAG